MKSTTLTTWIFVIGLGLVTPSSGTASDERELEVSQKSIKVQEEKPLNDKAATQQRKPVQPKVMPKKTPADGPAMPLYRPPLRGAPVGRIAGGTRGISDEYPALLCVLSPDHTGLTVQEQPAFYWFISEIVKHPIEFTLIEDQSIEPIIEKRIVSPEQPGIQCIRLRDYGVRLRQGILYKWFVALVPDSNRRSKDFLAWGEVRRVELSEELHKNLSNVADEKIPFIYAQAGLWYDAFSEISRLIESTPNDSTLRKQRAFLLEQIELQEIARHEMKQVDAD